MQLVQLFFVSVGFFLLSFPSQAEPWIANRFAENCSACHSPARRNLPAKERRCTLSCQGCHVNPNGGGLRSEYGVWNQQRWLRSFKTGFMNNKGTPAPLKFQKYADQPKNFTGLNPAADNIHPTLRKSKEQKLIPPPPPRVEPAVFHTVKAGENFGSLARQYKNSIKELRRMNGLKHNAILRPGQKIKVVEEKINDRKPNSEPPKMIAKAQPAKKLSPEDAKKLQDAAQRWEQMARQGSPLVVIDGVEYNMEDHDKYDNEWMIETKSRTEFLARLTEDDPYRLERQKTIFAGADFRYMFLEGAAKEESGAEREFSGAFYPMAFDMGIKYRPIPQKFSLVFEQRHLNGPLPKSAPGEDEQWHPEAVFIGSNATSQVRSAYMLVDDLPYATYVMYGLYKPMFAHHNPDHTTLLNSMLAADNRNVPDGYVYNRIGASSARAVHKALTIGGSPNVPFANFHLIMPTEGRQLHSQYHFTQDEGWALNLGGRFVTYGASMMFSYWDTTGPRGTNTEDLDTKMWALTGGITHLDMILNFDYTNIKREFLPGSNDKSTIQSLEFKYRLWREVYAQFNYSTANTSRNLKRGDASETGIGIKSFLIPGVEFETMMVRKDDRNRDLGLSTSTDFLQAQLHLFF